MSIRSRWAANRAAARDHLERPRPDQESTITLTLRAADPREGLTAGEIADAVMGIPREARVRLGRSGYSRQITELVVTAPMASVLGAPITGEDVLATARDYLAAGRPMPAPPGLDLVDEADEAPTGPAWDVDEALAGLDEEIPAPPSPRRRPSPSPRPGQ